jgi:hypothetical protein
MGGSTIPVLMREWKWSDTEKAAARRAFDLVLHAELEAVIRETKARAARIFKIDDVWKLEHWLGKRRREIDDKFDYRYSVLPEVFAVMISKGQLRLEQLHGIAPEKLEAIEKLARFYGGERNSRLAHSQE